MREIRLEVEDPREPHAEGTLTDAEGNVLARVRLYEPSENTFRVCARALAERIDADILTKYLFPE